MADLTISVSIDANGTKNGAEDAKRAVRGIGEEAGKTAKTYVDSTGRMRDENGKFVKSADDARRSATSLAKVDFSNAIKQLKEYASKIKEVGDKISGVGESLSLKLTAPILGLALLIGGLGASYESALNTFQAVTKATAEEMSQASQVAKQFGADVDLPATSAKDAALAMAELGKAGLTAAQSMAAAKGVLQLAAAGQLDEAKAAEITANALNSFNLAATESTRVADLLAAASNASSAEVTDIAESFNQASASFAAAKVPIEDLTTAIAIMANAGIKGSDAGTSLKTFLSSIQAPSTKGADAMKQLGVQIFDTAGRMKSLPDIIGQFDKALSGLTDEQKVQAIQNIFGSDASRAAQILFRDGAAGFEKIKEAVTQTGAAADLAAAKTKGVGGAFESLKSQAETIGITIYDALKGPAEQGLRSLADALGKVSDYLSNLAQSNPEIIQLAAIFLAVVAAIGPLLVALGAVVSFISSIAGGVVTLLPAFAAVGGAITGLGGFIISFIGLIGEAGLVASFGALASVVGGTIVSAIGAFLSALTPVAVGIAAIVAVVGVLIGIGVALVAAYQTNFGGLRDFINEVFDSIQQAISTALAYIQNLWATYGTQIITTATDTFNSIVEFIRPIMTEVVSTVREAFQTIVEVAGPLLVQIVNLVKTQLTVLYAGVKTILAAIASFWSENGEQIKAIVFSVWTILKTIVLGGIRQIANIITLVLALINGDWAGAWTAFKNIVQTGVNASITILKSLGALIVNVFSLVATKVFGIGKDIIQGLINGIKSGAAALYETTSNLANRVIGIFREVPDVHSPSRVTTEIGEFITEGLAVGIQNKETVAVNAAKKVSSAVVKAFQDAQKEFSKLAGASPETQRTIQQTNATSDAASAQQEIIKIRGELGINNDLSLPTDVAGTAAELKFLQERKKAIEETISPYEKLREIGDSAAKTLADEREKYQKLQDSIAETGANNLLQVQKEFELLGVTDTVEKQRIENAYELLALRQQLSKDGYGDGQIKEAVRLRQMEQARVLEWERMIQIKQQNIDLDKKAKDEALKAAEEQKKRYENTVNQLAGSLQRIFAAGAKDGFKGFLKQAFEELKNFGSQLLNNILGKLAQQLSRLILGKLGGGSSSSGSTASGTNGAATASASASGSGSAFSSGLGYAALGASVLGGLVGGRAGTLLSAAGSGLGIGLAIGGPVGAVVGLGVGALSAIFGGLFSDPTRKRDKNEKLPQLQKGFTDALQQLRSLGADKNAFYANPEDTIQKAMELRAQIASGFGLQFESKKYRQQAQQQITQKLVEADGIIAELNKLKDRATRARDVDTNLQTSFASGVYVRDDQMRDMQRYKRRNGMLGGTFIGIDTLPSMLARGEMVLNPAQIANVILNAQTSSDDPFKKAGIPGYASGAYFPSSSPPSPTQSASVNSSQFIVQPQIQVVLKGEGISNVEIEEILVDGLKKDSVQVEIVKAYDKGKSRSK